ncbi:hypothetical protein [Bacillus nitratireducens]|uniref:hypothetical protein n=1 Tax=Bacillus nitratireducens TaxID=2026193 RepID=UPI0033931365
MISVHDNIIISYQVNLENEEIRMHTRTGSGKDVYVFFSGVLAHFFETEQHGSVIFDIEKSRLLYFFKENEKLLEEKKDYVWPMRYKDIKELEDILINEKYFYYRISSSYGLSGWVLAKKLEILDSY